MEENGSSARAEQKLYASLGRQVHIGDYGVDDVSKLGEDSNRKTWFGLGAVKLDFKLLKEKLIGTVNASLNSKIAAMEARLNDEVPGLSRTLFRIIHEILNMEDDDTYQDLVKDVKLCENIKEVEDVCQNRNLVVLILSLTKKVDKLREEVDYLRGRVNYLIVKN